MTINTPEVCLEHDAELNKNTRIAETHTSSEDGLDRSKVTDVCIFLGAFLRFVHLLA